MTNFLKIVKKNKVMLRLNGPKVDSIMTLSKLETISNFPSKLPTYLLYFFNTGSYVGSKKVSLCTIPVPKRALILFKKYFLNQLYYFAFHCSSSNDTW